MAGCDVEILDSVTTSDGREVRCVRLRAGAFEMDVVDAGCAITRLLVPGRSGAQDNIVLGYGDLREYLGTHRDYFGTIVGRVANRIAGGDFELGGRTYRLARNDGRHHLHGGNVAFDRRTWRLADVDATSAARIALQMDSGDGDEGYPGALTARVTYELTAQELRLEYQATSESTTIVNLTNHTYFNLRGEATGDVLQHTLQIAADSFCAVDATLIPTGELRRVDETAFDFRAPMRIGEHIRATDAQIAVAGGYDHCFVLRPAHADSGELREACVLEAPGSGRRLRVLTDQPGVQFYSGNFLDGSAVGTSGVRYGRHAGLCLETQALPDAPHHPWFRSIVLEPGQQYRAVTVWRFEVLP